MFPNRTENAVDRTERKVVFMSAVAEASQLLREISEPWPVGETFKGAINRVTAYVNRIGREKRIIAEPIKASRVEDLWRQHARRVDAEEMDAIRTARALIKAAKQEKDQGDARDEYTAMSAEIAALQAALRLSLTDEGRTRLAEIFASGRGLDSALD